MRTLRTWECHNIHLEHTHAMSENICPVICLASSFPRPVQWDFCRHTSCKISIRETIAKTIGNATPEKFWPGRHSCPPSSLVSPKRVVGCRGVSRYIEGCWGFPYLKKVSRFLGFLVPKCVGLLVYGFLLFRLLVFGVWCLGSWFLGFKVPKFLGFKVSWFLSFNLSMIPYYQNSISCFREDIDPIFKIFKQ